MPDGLLEVAQRFLSDRDFREQLLIDPRATLGDLGVSEEAYRALVAMVPVLLAGGAFLLDRAVLGGQIVPDMAWGRP